jgi:hypothetical protein
MDVGKVEQCPHWNAQFLRHPSRWGDLFRFLMAPAIVVRVEAYLSGGFGGG